VLATVWLSAAEILETYKQVLQFQASLRRSLERTALNLGGRQSLPSDIDFVPLLQHFRELLRTFTRSNGTELAVAAKELEAADQSYLEDLIRECWAHESNGEPAIRDFFTNAFLQTVAEYLVQKAAVFASNYSRPVCPYCGRKPVCGVLRPEGDGAKRSLICSFCSTEWEYRRLVCPACEQEDVHRLPVFTAESFPHIRIEACDVCHAFIKTIDLTKDGRAIPVVDEIASLPLTLWAEEKGYKKLQRNLLLM
jgi:FdhE protein